MMEHKPVKLKFEEFGAGIPVILIHGFPLNHTTWLPVVNLLKAHCRLILPDLRGFGGSPVVEKDGSMRAMAEDIACLMDDLKLEKAVLAGHSMGGYVCLNFARAYPQRLLGLALVTTQSVGDAPERRQARLVMAEDVRRKGNKAIAESMAARLTNRAELHEPLKQLILNTPPKGVIAALHGMAERPDSTDWLAEIVVPAVVIAGTEDAIMPMERSQTMAQMLNHAWLVEVNGGAHMPMLEMPEVVADALLQLIRLVK